MEASLLPENVMLKAIVNWIYADNKQPEPPEDTPVTDLAKQIDQWAEDLRAATP